MYCCVFLLLSTVLCRPPLILLKPLGCLWVYAGCRSLMEIYSAPLPTHFLCFLSSGQPPGNYIPGKEGLVMNRWAHCIRTISMEHAHNQRCTYTQHKGRMPHETHPLGRTRIGRRICLSLCSSFWRSPTSGLTQRVPPQSAPPILHKLRLVTIVAIVKAIGVCSISSGVASPHCSHALG